MAEKQTRKAGAKPLEQAESVGPEMDVEALAVRSGELAVLGEHDAAVAESAGQLAKTVGYTGPITAPALADGIRFYQHRTAEAALEIGKRLLLLKEITPHGEFQPAVEALGFSPHSARKFMQATLKFSKQSTSTVLAKAAVSQSNLLELMVLDDEELDALGSGESVNGITLDDVERMSTRELRAALRTAHADLEAKVDRAAKLSSAVERAEEKAAKAARAWKKAAPNEQLETLLSEARKAATAVSLAIAADSEEAGLSGALIALMEHAEQHGLNVQAEVGGMLADLINDLRMVRDGSYVRAPVIMDKPYATWNSEGGDA